MAVEIIRNNDQSISMLTLDIIPISSHLVKIVIKVNPELTASLYDQTIKLFSQKKLDGFTHHDVPVEYVKDHFKKEIHEKLKHYLFKYHIIHFLYDQIMHHKITLSNYPRLNNITITENAEIAFNFDAAVATSIELKEWKHFSFKTPRRKKYKDLDKQVTSFLDNELTFPKKAAYAVGVESGDWVCFNATLTDFSSNQILQPTASSPFWIKIKNEEVVDRIKDIFLGRKVEESFIASNLEVDDQTSDNEQHRYNFLISIRAIVKNLPPTVDCFKNTFRLKNKLDIHNKLMEIFSYRNDQSQRKAIVEELFHLLLTKHRFEIPKHLVIRRQEDILINLMQQPDYHVYKSQKDFIEQVELLAEKQLKEEILIDQISYKENLVADLKDIEQYLYLYNNKRLREFIYFKPLLDRIDIPNRIVNAFTLGQTVLREKTLNYVIHTLSN